MIKTKPCPICNSKPICMGINDYSGYYTCVFCHTSTPVFENDNYNFWKNRALLAWNEMASNKSQKLQVLL